MGAGDGVANVQTFGAQGTAVFSWQPPAADPGPDDSGAVQAAIDSLGANGGTVWFPAGTYRLTQPLDLDERTSISLAGPGGPTSGAQGPSTLFFDVADDVPNCVSCRSSTAIQIRGLTIGQRNLAFHGDVVDFSHGPSGYDAARGLIENCLLGSHDELRVPPSALRPPGFEHEALGVPAPASRTRSLVSFERAIICTVRNCHIGGGARYGILGVSPEHVSDRYSNAIQVIGCDFNDTHETHIAGVGQAWLIHGNTFEPLATRPMVAPRRTTVRPAGGIAGTPESGGVSVVGNWFGDSDRVGSQIVVNGSGWTITGNMLGGGDDCITITRPASLGGPTAAQGIVIQGNMFASNNRTIVADDLLEGVIIGPNYVQP
jgi:hypothetical protein